MADNEKNKSDKVPEITSIANEDTLTEIDIGAFLEDKDSEAVVYDGFHEDIRKAEKSLDEELESLYEDIMKKTPSTVVPQTLDELTAEEPEPSPMDGMWMSPEEYVEMPEEVLSQAPEVEASEEIVSAKDDIFKMIEDLKSETENEKGYGDIIAGIEADEKMRPVDTDLSKTANIPSLNKNGIDTDSEEFKDELAELLGEKPAEVISEAVPVQAEEKPVTERPSTAKETADIPVSQEKEKFTVSIPDEPAVNAAALGINTDAEQRTVGVVPAEIIEDDGKISRKEKKQAKKAAKEADGKKSSGGNIARSVVLTISIIVIIVSSGYLINHYVIDPYLFKKSQKELVDVIDNNAVDDYDAETANYPEGMMAKYRKLYDINSDLRGWISIPALEINLPIAQGADNDYYLHRNIYKKWTNYGVPFYDYRINDFKELPRNTVIYGHNMHYDDLIFGLLENYRDISGFQSAPAIECNTIYGDHIWFVYAVFITNSRNSDDNGYTFPYNFVDISTEKFVEYIGELDKRKFYTTGVDINPTDKILTLSTCCYDFDDARLVVVARLRRDNESVTVDTTKAYMNNNPRYPQAWYDAMKKSNPYAEDANWRINTNS